MYVTTSTFQRPIQILRVSTHPILSKRMLNSYLLFGVGLVSVIVFPLFIAVVTRNNDSTDTLNIVRLYLMFIVPLLFVFIVLGVLTRSHFTFVCRPFQFEMTKKNIFGEKTKIIHSSDIISAYLSSSKFSGYKVKELLLFELPNSNKSNIFLENDITVCNLYAFTQNDREEILQFFKTNYGIAFNEQVN